MATRFVDSLIAYRILRLLVIPFTDTEAYKLGIIDEKGKELKKMRELNTVAERDAYTLLHRLVFRLKKIIEKVPVENKKLLTFAAALALIKEHNNLNLEPIDLEYQFLNKLNENLDRELEEVNGILNSRLLTFKMFIEEAPANNAAATPGIAGFTPETMGVRKKKIKMFRRKLNV